jgi:hypothetical protein
MTDKDVQRRTCRVCGTAFDFNEDENIYEDLCSRCAEMKFPLAFAVRKRVQESCGTVAAREVFTEKHDGCLPNSMIGEDLMGDIMTLFKTIGHVVAEAAGLPEEQHTVIVEPSYEDTTWWMITKDTSGGLPEPVKSHIVYFNYTKAWHLGNMGGEDAVEEWLRDMKETIIKSTRDVRLVEDTVQLLKSAKLSLLS